jgi:antagonist of KipI
MLTTIQDIGRFGFQRYGVPISGAMDSFALTVANILVKNERNSACLEMTLTGPTLKTLNSCTVAITGADMKPRVNHRDTKMWTSLALERDDVLELSVAECGCRAYLAVLGGIHIAEVLGSRSTYLTGHFGGYEGRAIRKGDVLRGKQTTPEARVRCVPSNYVPSYLSDSIIRVIMGPQDDFFTESGINAFLGSTYRLTSASDRMGYRLEGSAIEHCGDVEIVSDGVAAGAIQVPGSRLPIILMRDAQTTGGYPKIAYVISQDIDRLAQLRPGNRLSFERVNAKEARREIYQGTRLLTRLEEAISEVDRANDFPDSQTLMRFRSAIE